MAIVCACAANMQKTACRNRQTVFDTDEIRKADIFQSHRAVPRVVDRSLPDVITQSVLTATAYPAPSDEGAVEMTFGGAEVSETEGEIL